MIYYDHSTATRSSNSCEEENKTSVKCNYPMSLVRLLQPPLEMLKNKVSLLVGTKGYCKDGKFNLSLVSCI